MTEDEYYYVQQGVPIPAGAQLCCYGRFGQLGKGAHDGWLSLTKPIQVVAMVVATGIFAALLNAAASPKASIGERVLISGGGALCAVAVVVVLGVLWALTPWGKRSHWKVVRHPYTFGYEGVSLVSDHYHSVAEMVCESTTPDGTRAEVQIPFPPRVSDGQRFLAHPGKHLHTQGLSAGSGRYRFAWKIRSDGCPKRITVAKASFVVE